MRTAFWKAPAPVRSVLLPLRMVHTLIVVLRLDGWVMSGNELGTQKPLSILYYGTKNKKNYLASLAFGASPDEAYLGKRWLWQIRREANRSHCGIAVVEVWKHFRKLVSGQNAFFVPQMIDLTVQIPPGISEMLTGKPRSSLTIGNTSLKSDLNKIKRNAFSFRIAKDTTLWRDFYENMHVPFIGRVHGNIATFEPYEIWVSQLKSEELELLHVLKSGVPIAGVLLRTTKGKAALVTLGVKDGKADYVAAGAIHALFYFSFCYLQGMGNTEASLGGCRAFLQDPVMAYKRKWHPRVSAPRESGFLIRALSTEEGVRGFLINNPFVYCEGKKLKAAIFAEGEQSSIRETRARLHVNTLPEGLSQVVVFVPSQQATALRRLAER